MRIDHISPTGINLYRECPRKFYYYYLKKKSMVPPFRKALDFGSLIHNIIADYYRTIPDDIVPDSAIHHLKQVMKKYSSQLYDPETRDRAERQLENFLRFERKRLRWHFSPRPVAVEKEYRKGVIHGFVDALFMKEGKLVVVDWKTGKGQSGITEAIAVQLNTYMYLTGAEEAYVLFLEYGRFDKLEYEIDIETIVNEIMADNVFAPRRGDHCRFCEYQILCNPRDFELWRW